MWPVKRIKIRSFEVGLVFRDGEFRKLLGPGVHWRFDPADQLRVDIMSRRDPWLAHAKLDLMVRSGALAEMATVVDLKDHQRALVWIDGRFSHILPPGLYAYWRGFRDVRLDVIDVQQPRFEHPEFALIVKSPSAVRLLTVYEVPRDHAGVLFHDGKYVETLGAGRYAFWQDVVEVQLPIVDLRETTIDIGGQDIMTADKVTLRLNAVVACRVVDARKAIGVVDGARQALYREAQLALRAAVGLRELDALLADKDALAADLAAALRERAAEVGLELTTAGIRDVILPGEMKDLMNKVTEAKKAAEANLIARREETAAIRSQLNTARLLVENPTLMRLRELEVLEKVAANSKLNVVLGEKGLADRVVNLL